MEARNKEDEDRASTRNMHKTKQRVFVWCYCETKAKQGYKQKKEFQIMLQRNNGQMVNTRKKMI